jgi:hypothetical protein
MVCGRKSEGKNSSTDNSNLDSSNDSDAASIENQQIMVKIVQFFSRELEKVHHDHAAAVATLNSSNDVVYEHLAVCLCLAPVVPMRPWHVEP